VQTVRLELVWADGLKEYGEPGPCLAKAVAAHALLLGAAL